MAAQRKQRPLRRRTTTTSPEARWRTWANLLPTGLASDTVTPVASAGAISSGSVTPQYEFAVDTREGDDRLDGVGSTSRTARGPGKNMRPQTRRKRLRPPHIGRNLDLEA